MRSVGVLYVICLACARDMMILLPPVGPLNKNQKETERFVDESTQWWLMAGVLVVAELATGSFYLLMIALGAVAGALAAHAGFQIEVELVTAAVVAKPDAKWGEVPCAFVELRAGFAPTEAEVISFCRGHLAGFKVPKAVVFGLIPKTSTGKLQKFVLRQQLQSASAIA